MVNPDLKDSPQGSPAVTCLARAAAGTTPTGSLVTRAAAPARIPTTGIVSYPRVLTHA